MKKSSHLQIFRNLALITFSSMIFYSCVSVKIGAEDDTQSNLKTWNQKPPTVKHESLKNGGYRLKSGRVLSAFQDCKPSADLSLETLSRDALKTMSEVKIIQEKSVQFQNRRSVQILATGEIDGISIKILQQVVKKNGCSYFFNLTGSQNQFEVDVPSFEGWVQSQELP